METHDRPPAYAFSNGQPTSPPATPGSRSYPRFPPQTHKTSPIYKRMGIAMLAQSPPLEFIEPIGNGPTFHFTRPQSRAYSSRPSSASGHACATNPQESEEEEESENESHSEPERITRRVEYAEFVLEELNSDPEEDSETEVVRPDHIEDAKSDKGEIAKNGLIEKLSGLRCNESSTDEEERQRIYRRKKKRWSAGIFKRSHSQSVGSDSDYDDNDALDDVDSSARRLRRRVRGPSDKRSSLIFEDNGFSNANNIVEVEEPDEGGLGLGLGMGKGPPSIPSDDGFTLDELPFWVMEDPMDVEFDSC